MHIIARPLAICTLLFLYSSVVFAGAKEELLGKGRELWTKKDYAAAVQTFAKVIEMDQTCADGYYGRGATYVETRDYDLAIKDFSEAIHRDPRFARYLKRGISYFATGRTAEAESDVNEAIRLDAKDAEAYACRSSLNRERGDFRSAIADANEAIRLDAQCAAAFYSRSIALFGGATSTAHLPT